MKKSKQTVSQAQAKRTRVSLERAAKMPRFQSNQECQEKQKRFRQKRGVTNEAKKRTQQPTKKGAPGQRGSARITNQMDVDSVEVQIQQDTDSKGNEVAVQDPTTVLPMEVLLDVFEYLSNAELLQACRVSRWWRAVASSGSAWYKRGVMTRGPPGSRVTRGELAFVLREVPRASVLVIEDHEWDDVVADCSPGEARCAVTDLRLVLPRRADAADEAAALLRRQAARTLTLPPLQSLLVDVPGEVVDAQSLLLAINACTPCHVKLTTEKGLSRADYPIMRAPRLAGVVSSVRALSYDAFSDRQCPDVALVYLLTCHAATLVEVDVQGVSPRLRLGALLSRCARLRILSCEACDDLRRLRRCPCLEVVKLRGFACNVKPVVRFLRKAWRLKQLQLDDPFSLPRPDPDSDSNSEADEWTPPGRAEVWKATLRAVQALARPEQRGAEPQLTHLSVIVEKPPAQMPVAAYWDKLTAALARLKHLVVLDLMLDHYEWQHAPLPTVLFERVVRRLRLLELPCPVHCCTPQGRAFLRQLCHEVAANPRLHVVDLVRACACTTMDEDGQPMCVHESSFELPDVHLGDTFNLYGHGHEDPEDQEFHFANRGKWLRLGYPAAAGGDGRCSLADLGIVS